jgi:phosphatidylglycerol:prolipoprotein diacylglycerol transferase
LPFTINWATSPSRKPPTDSADEPTFSLLGILVTLVLWWRCGKPPQGILLIYLAGIGGGFLGAKIAYLFSEGWLHSDDPQRWMYWISGKSIMGALPGGWIGVELAKKLLHFRQTTGDRFAISLPIPLILGRIGCLDAGCCQGIVTRHGLWPAVPMEMVFLVIAMLALLILRAKKILPGQHFHLFLITYGIFRLGHEFLRDTPKPFLGFSGYQIIAFLTAAAAMFAYKRRTQREQE